MRWSKRKGLLAAAAGALVAAGAGTAWYVNRTYVAITVEGSSMTPTLHPGDRVLIRRGRARLKRDDIVVIREPRSATKGWAGQGPAGRDLSGNGWYIKRCVALPGDPMDPRVKGFGDTVPEGHILVIGDHPHSGDSKQHGPCPIDQVLGIVVRQMERKEVKETAPEGWRKVRFTGPQWVELEEGGKVLLPAEQHVYVPNFNRVSFTPPNEWPDAGDAMRFPAPDGLDDREGEPGGREQ